MTLGKDDSLTIYIQHEQPRDPEKLPNCLPAPDGNFMMFLRVYLSGYPILSQWWEPPALIKEEDAG